MPVRGLKLSWSLAVTGMPDEGGAWEKAAWLQDPKLCLLLSPWVPLNLSTLAAGKMCSCALGARSGVPRWSFQEEVVTVDSGSSMPVVLQAVARTFFSLPWTPPQRPSLSPVTSSG